jgi:hypothetical protein
VVVSNVLTCRFDGSVHHMSHAGHHGLLVHIQTGAMGIQNFQVYLLARRRRGNRAGGTLTNVLAGCRRPSAESGVLTGSKFAGTKHLPIAVPTTLLHRTCTSARLHVSSPSRGRRRPAANRSDFAQLPRYVFNRKPNSQRFPSVAICMLATNQRCCNQCCAGQNRFGQDKNSFV